MGGWGRMVGLHAQRVNGVTVRTVGGEPRRASLSDRILIAANRCAAFFVSPVTPAHRNQARRCSVGARCRPCHRFTPPDTWTRPPSRAPRSLKIAPPKSVCSCRQLQNIRLSADAANSLTRTQN